MRRAGAAAVRARRGHETADGVGRRPNADIVWEAVKTIDSAKGTEEIRPKTDDEWTALRNAAIIIVNANK